MTMALSMEYRVNSLRNAFVLLTLAIAVAAPAIGREAPTSQPATVEKIGVTKFDALRADEANIVLDVRTPEEFAEGHVPGAINAPYSKAGFDAAIAALDKSKTYLVYCHSGKRSFLSTKLMQSAGFAHLFNFSGGIVAWEKAGKAMETQATGAHGATTKPS
jgi:rhodanese-related sulfurtransferase